MTIEHIIITVLATLLVFLTISWNKANRKSALSESTASQLQERVASLESQYSKAVEEKTSEYEARKNAETETQLALQQVDTMKKQLEDRERAKEEQIAQYNKNLEETKKQFQHQFENLANKIFEEKNKTFNERSQKGIQEILNPFKERFQEFQKIVNESFGTHAKEQFALKKEIQRIVTVNEKMTLEAKNLTKALKGDVKAQGNWGEVILEKILEDSGLRKDEDYIIQGTGLGLKDQDSGQVQRPDVIVKLPEDKHIIIDSKLSLTHYERFCGEEDETKRGIHLKQFITSVKTHVNGLEARRYQDSDKLGTPDFVLMFMPIEGAYSLAIQSDHEIHRYAWDRKIVIVCPSTLFATLKTISSVWKMELQNRNTIEIARQGGALYDKIASFIEDMQKIGSQLGTVQKSYDGAMNKLSTGRGNILKRTEDLKALGAKASKKLPVELIDSETLDDTKPPQEQLKIKEDA